MRTSYICNLKKIAVSIFILSSTISTFASASSPPSESPAANDELICHTDNPAECYPKVFSPTEEFQILHDDQDLPPGLHVQLDVQTGQKQAKLNNPNEGNPALEGLPVDRSVVVVDSETSQDDHKPPLPPGAPAYEPVGVVKAPKEKNEGFTQALETVKNSHSVQSSELDQALQDLEDLSHDMYYGLQIAGDVETLQALLCLLTKQDSSTEQAEADQKRPLTERPGFVASSILASAIRNNKPALQAVEGAWDVIAGKQCAGARSLKAELYANLEPTTDPASAAEAAEAYSTRLHLTVLDGLLQSPKIKAEFLANDGMQRFLQILLRKEAVWDARKAKVARIVSDIFLDEEVGAVLGVWPSSGDGGDGGGQEDAGVCAKEGDPKALGEGCWEYHLEVIGRDPKDAEWSGPLLERLRERRRGGGERDEL